MELHYRFKFINKCDDVIAIYRLGCTVG